MTDTINRKSGAKAIKNSNFFILLALRRLISLQSLKASKEKIFDAYYRSSNAHNIKGEGIGLFVVKENLNLLNGTITVNSELNKGSNFIINIPLTI